MNQKIKLIGDLSLKKGEIQLAIDCFEKIDDLSSLLMIYSSLQMDDKLKTIAQKAEKVHQLINTDDTHEHCLHVLLFDK